MYSNNIYQYQLDIMGNMLYFKIHYIQFQNTQLKTIIGQIHAYFLRNGILTRSIYIYIATMKQ